MTKSKKKGSKKPFDEPSKLDTAFMEDYVREEFEDPVAKQKKDEAREKRKLKKTKTEKKESTFSINPNLDIRVNLQDQTEERVPKKYEQPRLRKVIEDQKRRKEKQSNKKKLCDIEKMELDVEKDAKKLQVTVDIPSPEASSAKVVPRKPSVTKSDTFPDEAKNELFTLKEPRSGIYINVDEDKLDYDSFDLVYTKTPRPGFDRAKRKKKGDNPDATLPDITEEEEEKILKEMSREKGEGFFTDENLSEEEEEEEEGEEEGEGEDEYLTKIFRKKVEQMSRTTSYQMRDLIPTSEKAKDHDATHATQRYRRPSEVQRYMPSLGKSGKFKRGTLESHSYTKFDQKTLKNFYFGSKAGTIHQGDEHFSPYSRGNQGLCIPVAAYCFSLLKHPNKWLDKDIDKILDSGTKLYEDSLNLLHKHKSKQIVKLEYNELVKYCYLGTKKIRFRISEPMISGMIRSETKNVFNLSKGMHIFFSKYKSGIFQTIGTDMAIWKDKHYFFFDGSARSKDLYQDPNGTAIMAHFYDVASIITILLDRCHYGNMPYVLYSLNAFKIMDWLEPDDKDSNIELNDRSNYNILNDTKAVVQASFDLGDKCFDFTRNKQALTIAVIALAYSRITPPAAWHKRILDKIMIIGNQLFVEITEGQTDLEVNLFNLPSTFTVGPYIVEIFIRPNVATDLIMKNGQCMLEWSLEKFFEKYASAILYIRKAVMAVWTQRNVYYLFDPYSRNKEAFNCRSGTACVSMHSNIKSLIEVIVKNYSERDLVYVLNALIVVKIHRDPSQSKHFEQRRTMDDYNTDKIKNYKMIKSHKPAASKTVTVLKDFNLSIFPPDEIEDAVDDVGSNILSLQSEEVPPLITKKVEHPHPPKKPVKEQPIIDLDSPSLSETQIEPPKPDEAQIEAVEFPKVDIISYQLTQEELEKGIVDTKKPAIKPEILEEEGDEEGEEIPARHQHTSIGSNSLMGGQSAMMNTSFIEIPNEIIPPASISAKQKRLDRLNRTYQEGHSFRFEDDPEITQSEELRKEHNYIELPDDSQIVRGTNNISTIAQKADLEYAAPFVSIMATVVAKKYSLVSWSTDIVDYVIKCGGEMFKASSSSRYDQVAKFEVPRISLGKTDYNVVVEYLFDTFLKDNILEMALDKILFKRCKAGIFVTPFYSCAVFLKNHVYYLYDSFPNNDLGLSEGPNADGKACIMRFKNIKSLVQRIIHNKAKREGNEEIEYTRFVLSTCMVQQLPKKDEEGGGKTTDSEGDKSRPSSSSKKKRTKANEEEEKKKKHKEAENIQGYELHKGMYTIQGTTQCEGRGAGNGDLKEDHFVSICACLMLIEVPIELWDTKKVDKVIKTGKHVFSHAADLTPDDKRIIKNIPIQKHLFDIIVKRIKIATYKQRGTIGKAIDTLFSKKHNYFMVQLDNACYVVYKNGDTYHVFDPYAIQKPDEDKEGNKKPKKDGQEGEGEPEEEEEDKEYHAGWIKFNSLRKMKQFFQMQVIDNESGFNFYSFDITSIKKAPKSMIIDTKVHEYEVEKPVKHEVIGKPFFEEIIWLDVDPVPWSRRTQFNASGQLRGPSGKNRDNMWHNWDIEYKDDLYSMVSNINQKHTRFPVESRNKQTLANLICAIGMIEIYNLSEWNSSIIDSILVNGDNYHRECTKDIKDKDYELCMEDLKPNCSIFPYDFKVEFEPIVEGTMFIKKLRAFNLYKALRYFFDKYEARMGIIITNLEGVKSQVAFGKLRDSEYFMFDSKSDGPPMFLDKKGKAYILRITTLNRLLHVLTLTLRGGDFYIYEVITSEFNPLDEAKQRQVQDEKDQEKQKAQQG